MSKKNILFFSSDVGSKESIFPIYNNLNLFDYNRINISQKKKYSIQDIDLAILGSSRSRNKLSPELKLIKKLKKFGIPSITILDFYGFYEKRFIKSIQKNINSDYCSEIVCCFDREQEKDLIKFGIDKNLIRITNNPKYDEIYKKARNFKSVATSNDLNILFVSQNLISNNFFDKSQYFYFNEVIAALKEHNKTAIIYLKTHPNERKQDWEKHIERHDLNEHIKIIFKNDYEETLPKFSLIIGFFSTLIYKFCYYGIPNISLDYQNKFKENILVQFDLSIPINSKQKLRKYLNEFDLKEEKIKMKKTINNLKRRNVFFSKGNSVKTIIKIIDSFFK